MNIKMTDNLYEFRKYILEDLIKRGYKYIARDSNGSLYAYSDEPTKQSRGWDFEKKTYVGRLRNISLLSPIFTNIKWEDEKPFEITYTNWDSVPVDTNVIVTGLDGSEWKCHFCRKLNNNSILVYRNGKTSWTTLEAEEVDINNVRLE